MQTLSQLPEEGQRDIARSLGYMGKKVGFPAFLQSNPSAAKEYQDIAKDNINYLDKLKSENPSKKFSDLKKLFKKSTILERDFWETFV